MLTYGLRALAASFALITAAPAVAGTASFLVVHGIPGRDVGPGIDPLLPVDVLVNGQVCLIKDLTFGHIAGPFDVPSGTYTVAVSLSNPISPCSNSPVISGSVTFSDGEFGAAVAEISRAGAPALGIYPVSVAPLKKGMQRFVIVHSADAPAVNVVAASSGKPPAMLKATIKPDTEATADVATSPKWDVTVTLPNGSLGPIPVSGADRSLFAFFAVGVGKTGSLTVFEKTIPDVF